MKNFFNKLLFITVLTSLQTGGYAQDLDLGKADSLFEKTKYTEAFQIYEKIFDARKASPSMLIKMAFIKEGLGNYTEALYYLNLYYKESLDKDALTKMREIAEKHNLYGYEYSDSNFFRSILQKYLNETIFSLLAVSLFLFIYGYKRKQRHEKPVLTSVFQFVIIAIVALLVNGVLSEERAIITKDHVPLLSGPSAGAEPIETVDKGHNVKLLKKGPVWGRILWKDQAVYVRTKNLKEI